ncbi:unnamed protein product [Protopolystoma xenopodis]|uniref:Uncharacterized protein n=1 Tax=Protopolystoma xenopodis TaxID=117903 RepID=A0A448WXX9_9PLAT|nr:unnamed protein product [Protopolystoma xenopodis]
MRLVNRHVAGPTCADRRRTWGPSTSTRRMSTHCPPTTADQISLIAVFANVNCGVREE